MNRIQIRQFHVDLLEVKVSDSREEMGRAAAEDAARHIKLLQERQEEVRIVFAAAPSQREMLRTLSQSSDIDWSRVTAFHMDEYIGLPREAEQSFGYFLTEHLFRHVKPGKVHLIDGSNESGKECERYGRLLAEAPIDIVCLGIGENGHIAFNDPPVADFADRHPVKAVELDMECRMQQVNDGCFPRLEDVPTHAFTLTIPTLMSGGALFCCVPGAFKRRAVMRTLQDEIGEACPATVLRRHRQCTLYVDNDSFDEEQGKTSHVPS